MPAGQTGAARAVGIVLQKEFLDNVRNRWILGLSAIFVVLTLVWSYFGATQTGGGAGFQGFSDTIFGMLSITIFLVPILSLMLSYGSIVGEKESGSVHLLLAMPITRPQALVGKFLGLAAVITISVVAGLGIAGAVIMAFAGTEGWPNFLAFIVGTILLSLAFLSLGFLVSTVAKRRSVAVGLAVLIWFIMAVIFDLVVLGIHVAAGGDFSFLPGQQIVFPDWFYVVTLANPVDAFGYFASRVFNFTGALGFEYLFPDFLTVWTGVASMTLWALFPFLAALWLFQRQDV